MAAQKINRYSQYRYNRFVFMEFSFWEGYCCYFTPKQGKTQGGKKGLPAGGASAIMIK
jgi:hypothetical protein